MKGPRRKSAIGRPPKAAADVKSQHLAVKVKPHEERLLREVAERLGVHFSVWARTALLLDAVEMARTLGLKHEVDPKALGSKTHPLP